MSKKYLGTIISVLGTIGLIILNGIIKIYGIVADYQGLSYFDIVYPNFLLSYIIIILIIIVGIYLIAKDYFKNI